MLYPQKKNRALFLSVLAVGANSFSPAFQTSSLAPAMRVSLRDAPVCGNVLCDLCTHCKAQMVYYIFITYNCVFFWMCTLCVYFLWFICIHVFARDESQPPRRIVCRCDLSVHSKVKMVYYTHTFTRVCELYVLSIICTYIHILFFICLYALFIYMYLYMWIHTLCYVRISFTYFLSLPCCPFFLTSLFPPQHGKLKYITYTYHKKTNFFEYEQHGKLKCITCTHHHDFFLVNLNILHEYITCNYAYQRIIYTPMYTSKFP